MGCCQSKETTLVQSLKSEKSKLESQFSSLQLEHQSLLQSNSNLSTPEISNLNQEIINLKSTLIKEKTLKMKWVLNCISRYYKKHSKLNLTCFYAKWKNITLNLIEKSDNFNFDSGFLENYDDESFNQAQKLVEKENLELLAKSIVQEMYEKCKDTTVNLMSSQKILKFFEEMMDLKFIQDQGDLKDRRKPKTMPEFFIDYLNRSFGLKNIAIKSLNQMIPVLVSGQGHFLSFICKLLHISKYEPIKYSISLYISKLRSDFNQILNKLNKNSKLTKTDGGSLHINEIFVLVYTIFDKNRQVRNMFIKELKPDDVSQENYLLYLIWFKLTRLQMTSEELFDLIDLKKVKILSTKIVVNGICRVLDIPLDQDVVDVFVRIIDCKAVGKVTKEAFIKVLSNKNMPKDAEKMTVNKFRFLNCGLIVYSKVRLRSLTCLLYKLKPISSIDQESFNLDSFKEMLKVIEINLGQELIEGMFEEICNFGVNKESIAKVLVEYGIGDSDLRCFGIFYLVLPGLLQSFEKRRSEIIEGLLEECKSTAKLNI